MKLFLTIVVIYLSMSFISSQVFAKPIAVSEMHYKNKGAYDSNFYIRYNIKGKKCRVYQTGQKRALKGQKVKVKLWKDSFKSDISNMKVCLNKGKIPAKVEKVWGMVMIFKGEGLDNKYMSCKKGKDLVLSRNKSITNTHAVVGIGTGIGYLGAGAGAGAGATAVVAGAQVDEEGAINDKGVTVAYHTGGTNLNNNRCKKRIKK